MESRDNISEYGGTYQKNKAAAGALRKKGWRDLTAQ